METLGSLFYLFLILLNLIFLFKLKDKIMAKIAHYVLVMGPPYKITQCPLYTSISNEAFHQIIYL